MYFCSTKEHWIDWDQIKWLMWIWRERFFFNPYYFNCKFDLNFFYLFTGKLKSTEHLVQHYMFVQLRMAHRMSLMTGLPLFVCKVSSVVLSNDFRIVLFFEFLSEIISFKMIMENDKIDGNLRVSKSMRRLKHWLVFITFGVPMVFFLLNLLIWVILGIDTTDYIKVFIRFNFCLHFQPSKWIDIHTSPISIQLIWCSVVPITGISEYKKQLFSTELTCTLNIFPSIYVDIHRSIWRRN